MHLWVNPVDANSELLSARWPDPEDELLGGTQNCGATARDLPGPRPKSGRSLGVDQSAPMQIGNRVNLLFEPSEFGAIVALLFPSRVPPTEVDLFPLTLPTLKPAPRDCPGKPIFFP